MVDNSTDLQKFLDQILRDFFKTFDYEPFPISITLALDLWETYFSLRPDHGSKVGGQQTPDSHGAVVPPMLLDGQFTVLVDIKYLQNDLQNGGWNWVGTIIHEVTHARDYIQYTKLVGARSYDEVLNKSKYSPFHVWTEFNARRHGYYFLRKYTFQSMKDEAQLDFIVQTEMPFHIDYMSKECHVNKDGWEQLYLATQFMGRLSVWKELFPQYFTSNKIQALFDMNRWMYDMFIFLEDHHELRKAHNQFDKLREILCRSRDYSVTASP